MCDRRGEPINPSADVNASQNAEFTNFQYAVYNSTGGFASSGNPESQYDFWCGSNGTKPGANGSPLPVCAAFSQSSLLFSDADIVYDKTMGRWFASGVFINRSDNVPISVVFASSSGNDATDQSGNWYRWSLDSVTYSGLICPTLGYSTPDQRLLGFSTAFVALDITCYNGNIANPDYTNDTAILIPIANVTAGVAKLTPVTLSTANFGFRATPSRDRSVGGNSNIWFVSSVLPDSPSPASAPGLILNEVNSSGGIVSPSPISETLPFAAGNYVFANDAPQPGCTPSSACGVQANDGRIQAVDLQTRPTDSTSYLSYTFVYPVATGGYLDAFVMQATATPLAPVLTDISYNDGTYLLFLTIAMDADLNVEFTGTVFSSTQYPSVQVYQIRYYPDTQSNSGWALLSDGYLFNGSASYTGDANPPGCSSPPWRWGDFNTTIWDPYLQSSSSKPSTFWNIFE
jgi:hypothetical protein